MFVELLLEISFAVNRYNQWKSMKALTSRDNWVYPLTAYQWYLLLFIVFSRIRGDYNP